MDALRLVILHGKEVQPYVHDLAKLRIENFCDYPYLYEGNHDYEANYLRRYVECPNSIVILVMDGNEVVGASTALPLAEEEAACQQPFKDAGMDINEVFYLGESVLKKPYRGRHLYRIFFQEREVAARAHGCRIAAFWAVDRAIDDPRRPPGYIPLDEIWHHFGYQKQNQLQAQLEWKSIDEEQASPKTLTFWLKYL